MKKILLCIYLLNYFVYGGELPFIKASDYMHNNLKPDQYMSIEKGKKVMKAIKNKDIKALEKMLKNGLNPDSYFPYKHSFTLLQFAYSNKNIEIVKLLLKYGANPNILKEDDSRYVLATRQPIATNNFEMLNLFLKHGASINTEQPYRQIINCDTYNSITPPLFNANTKKMIKFLVSKGGNIYQKTARSETILDSYTFMKKKSIDFKKWLINKYKLPTTYFKCSDEINAIIKVVHTKEGFKEYDVNGTMVYEYNATK